MIQRKVLRSYIPMNRCNRNDIPLASLSLLLPASSDASSLRTDRDRIAQGDILTLRIKTQRLLEVAVYVDSETQTSREFTRIYRELVRGERAGKLPNMMAIRDLRVCRVMDEVISRHVGSSTKARKKSVDACLVSYPLTPTFLPLTSSFSIRNVPIQGCW